MLAQALMVWALMGASPAPEAAESASVLLAEARAPDGKATLEAYARIAPESPTPEVLPGELVLRLPKLGRATITLKKEAFAGAEVAYRHGIWSLISDTPLPAHAAQLLVELVPEPGVARVRVLEALVALCTALSEAHAGVAVYFAAGEVVHTGTYLAAAARKKLAAHWLWVGFELGGTKERLTLTSIGLAKASLRELELAVRRQDIGAAIETFFDLLTLALGRTSDFPDGQELPRKDAPPFVVKYAETNTKKVWQVQY